MRQKRRGSWLRSKNSPTEAWIEPRVVCACCVARGPCWIAVLRYSAKLLGSAPEPDSGCGCGVWSMFSAGRATCQYERFRESRTGCRTRTRNRALAQEGDERRAVLGGSAGDLGGKHCRGGGGWGGRGCAAGGGFACVGMENTRRGSRSGRRGGQMMRSVEGGRLAVDAGGGGTGGS